MKKVSNKVKMNLGSSQQEIKMKPDKIRMKPGLRRRKVRGVCHEEVRIKYGSGQAVVRTKSTRSQNDLRIK
jgi:hypothetical protein